MVYSSGEEGNDDIMSNLLKVQNVQEVLSYFHVILNLSKISIRGRIRGTAS